MKFKFILLSIFCVVLIFIVNTESALAQGKAKGKHKTKYKKETGPPPWAPAHGYRAKTRYVYFTEHNFYYDNNQGVYIYMSGKNWEVSATIPSLFKNIDLTGAVKIDLDLEADDPQRYNAKHLKEFKKG